MKNNPTKPISVNFYCPLKVKLDDPDEDDYVEIYNDILLVGGMRQCQTM